VTAVNTGLADLSDEQAGTVDVNDDDEVTHDDTYELYQLISDELPEVPDMGDNNGADDIADDADNGDDTTTETPTDENDSDSDENETETPDDGASTYHFQVERADDAGDEPNEQYEFTVTSNNGSNDDTSVDEGEPNDEPADATELDLGDTVSGVVNDSDDDWYAIELGDGQSITVNGTEFASDTVITAYRPTNTDDVSEDDLEAIGSGNFTIVAETLIEFEAGSTPDE
jgi:hypothetical protein